MSQACSIICSPNHDDRFVVCSSRCIRLWQIVPRPPGGAFSSSDLVLSKDFAMQQMKERQLIDNATAFAWHPTSDSSGSTLLSPDHLLAVGDANGRVVLTSLTEISASGDPCELRKLEFVPRYPRPTNFLHWNPFRKTLLAQGLDRARNAKECTILLWDVTEPITVRDNPSLVANIGRAVVPGASGPIGEPVPGVAGAFSRPFAEFAAGEVVTSFAWIGVSSFVAGISNKCIRVFDLPSTVRESFVTKAVYGLCFDLLSKNLIASFSGSQTSVWLLQKLDRPVSNFSLGAEHQVLQIAWCPTRSGYLAVLGKDARSVFVFDTMHISPGGNTEDLSQSIVERRVSISSLGSPHQLVSLAWLPSQTAAFLCVDANGHFYRKQLLEHVAIGFSPAENKLFWARGVDMGETSGEAMEADICHQMRRLALRNYGLDLDKSAAACAALFPEADHRHGMWAWLDHFSALVKPSPDPPGPRRPPSVSSRAPSASAPPPPPSAYILGVRGTLGMGPLTSPDPQRQSPLAPVPGSVFCQRSELCEVPWRCAGGGADSLPVRIVNSQFRSEERLRVLRLCQLAPETVSNSIDALRNAREFERAACLALIHLDFGLAMDVLRRGGEYQQRHPGHPQAPNLELIALALAGFSDERNRVWRTATRDLLPRLEHPYLRMMFMFIAAERPDDLEMCTQVSGVRVADRIALAALYLNDQKLRQFVEQLTCECIGKASLEGLILTGLGSESLELLQSYLDRTGDVQTVSLVCLLGLRLRSAAMREDRRPSGWARAYRDLLDGWRLWSHRAAFDIQRQACDPTHKPPPQIYVACGFCGGKVAQGVQPGGAATGRRQGGGSSAASGKTSICQACRKPLPRCAVCLMHTGTAAGMCGSVSGPDAARAVPMERWFVWCLKCRHGGHTAHIAAWFKENRDCPVSGCPCTCTELDRTSLRAVESVEQ